jgi:hypothetical protein
VENLTRVEDEIQKAEQYATLKHMLLRLLDDPQVQQKIVTFLRRRSARGSSDSRRVNAPIRPSRLRGLPGLRLPGENLAPPHQQPTRLEPR